MNRSVIDLPALDTTWYLQNKLREKKSRCPRFWHKQSSQDNNVCCTFGGKCKRPKETYQGAREARQRSEVRGSCRQSTAQRTKGLHLCSKINLKKIYIFLRCSLQYFLVIIILGGYVSSDAHQNHSNDTVLDVNPDRVQNHQILGQSFKIQTKSTELENLVLMTKSRWINKRIESNMELF